ncbi:hypothetical protein BJ508DRAFT_86508 [Ascobolus immersus RN42]|uniref:NTF2 domain-containing protein n=1 Tax=Ascobolus immersus RN42 TaxID=1160509 RepID=A0A3N4ID50_ASCIM|nr:hypothetical protein BJ508DRAFT_86508 [Ascobolus immersus RN42]
MATLLQKYQSFLARPVAGHLAEDASMIYTTTADLIQGADTIIKHFSKNNQLFSKRSDKQISVVETQDTLVYETDTSIEFRTGGGSFLPGLDDNFLSDQTVNFVLIHIVEFRNGAVQQVRLYWDQSTLLKQLGIIGRTGKNWPIKEGSDQVKIVTRAIKQLPERTGGSSQPAPATTRVTRSSSKASEQGEAPSTPRRAGARENLDLFSPVKDAEEDDGPRHRPAVVKPRTAHKPPSRGLGEIIGSEDDSTAPPQVDYTPKAKSKYGQPQQFQFGDDDDVPATPQRPYISRQKFANEHSDFLFAEENDDQNVASFKPKAAPKHQQKWDSTDMQTPEKAPIKERPSDERHFHFSDNEDDLDSPVKRPKKIVPRKDAEPHFELTDESPAPSRTARNVQQSQASGSVARGKHNSHFEFMDESPEQLGDKTNRPTAGRTAHPKGRYANDSNFLLADDSPIQEQQKRSYASNTQSRAAMANRNASWGIYDESPTPAKKADVIVNENAKAHGKHFEFSDESPAATAQEKRDTQQRARQGTANANNRMKQTGGDFWDF